MTDKEIIRNLECCITYDGNCNICPICSKTCVEDNLQNALALIKKLKKREKILKKFKNKLEYEIAQQKDVSHITFMTAMRLKNHITDNDLIEIKGYYKGLKVAREIFERVENNYFDNEVENKD